MEKKKTQRKKATEKTGVEQFSEKEIRERMETDIYTEVLTGLGVKPEDVQEFREMLKRGFPDFAGLERFLRQDMTCWQEVDYESPTAVRNYLMTMYFQRAMSSLSFKEVLEKLEEAFPQKEAQGCQGHTCGSEHTLCTKPDNLFFGPGTGIAGLGAVNLGDIEKLKKMLGEKSSGGIPENVSKSLFGSEKKGTEETTQDTKVRTGIFHEVYKGDWEKFKAAEVLKQKNTKETTTHASNKEDTLWNAIDRVGAEGEQIKDGIEQLILQINELTDRLRPVLGNTFPRLQTGVLKAHEDEKADTPESIMLLNAHIKALNNYVMKIQKAQRYLNVLTESLKI